MDADFTPTPETSPELSPEPAQIEKPRPDYRWVYWLPVAFIFGLAVGYFAFARPLSTKLTAAEEELAALKSEAQAAAAEAEALEIPEEVIRYDVPEDGDPSFGPADAPIVIIEYSDYECPYCQKWHNEVWPLLQENYGDQIRLVYKDYPLASLHAGAIPAAEAANCAGEQDKYWEYNTALFSGQYPFNRTGFETIAQELKLKSAPFTACLDDRRYQSEVEEDQAYADNTFGGLSTPTFFINGLALVGAQPYEIFSQVIEMELKGEIPQ
ncbi:MAG: thioredoxin domain-containing protein [Anaerolineaceae bacterium]|nr:thioredoxin domain-containing protein [Anaerolineaceae bacterium]